MARYYLSDTHIAIASKKEAFMINDCKDVSKVVEQWAKANGLKAVFVYDENYNFFWAYNFN